LPSQPPEGVRTKLRQLVDLQTQPVRSAGQPGAPGTAEAIAKIRQDISPDSATVTELERLFATQQAAKIALDATTSASNSRAYVGIFAAPENLVVIGRPHDPLTGQNPALKLVIAGLLLSVMIGAALVVASELLNGRLRMRREFEALTGLPVLARMPKITGRI
jgi:capsular polysaccharide biosynthesis protein